MPSDSDFDTDQEEGVLSFSIWYIVIADIMIGKFLKIQDYKKELCKFVSHCLWCLPFDFPPLQDALQMLTAPWLTISDRMFQNLKVSLQSFKSVQELI